MYKLLNWSYNKGVEHERLRIKKLLIEFSNSAHDSLRAFDPQSTKDKQRDLDDKIRANKIVEALLQPSMETTFNGPAPIDGDK